MPFCFVPPSYSFFSMVDMISISPPPIIFSLMFLITIENLEKILILGGEMFSYMG